MSLQLNLVVGMIFFFFISVQVDVKILIHKIPFVISVFGRLCSVGGWQGSEFVTKKFKN